MLRPDTGSKEATQTMASDASNPVPCGPASADTLAPPRHLVLVGLMGAGKTTVGSALARVLGCPLRDSDPDIEARTGKTVRELRDQVGTDRMHRLEADALLRSLDEPGPTIVAAAASTIEQRDCRERLHDPGIVTIWLRAAPATLARRFDSSTHRPAYGRDPARFLARQAARRDPLFGSVATFAVDVDGRSPGRTVATILERLASEGVLPPPGPPGTR